jgi:hypothetical protein
VKLKLDAPRAYHVKRGKTTYWVIGETESGKLRVRKQERNGKYGPIQTLSKDKNDAPE